MEKLVPNGYYGPEKVRFTVDESGTITSLAELPARGDTLRWSSGLNTKMLVLQNESRLLTEVTAQKDGTLAVALHLRAGEENWDLEVVV